MTNDEEAIVLYAQINHVLALASVLPDGVIVKTARRLFFEAARADATDKAALSAIAEVILTYIEEEDEQSEETKAKLAINKLINEGHKFKTPENFGKGIKSEDDEVWGDDGRLSPQGDE